MKLENRRWSIEGAEPKIWLMTDNKLLLLSKRLRKLRKEAGFTQEELARKADISVKYLQNLEGSEPKNPSLLTLEKIANGLDVPLTKLVSF